jgi:thiol-disulfide isomerase/thioredoxin
MQKDVNYFYVGKKYGYFTVLNIKNGTVIGKCDCGNDIKTKLSYLRIVDTISCGNCYNGKPYSSFVGKKYGLLTVLHVFKDTQSKATMAFCKCECTTTKNIRLPLLEDCTITSCGHCFKGKPYSSFVGKKYGLLTVVDTNKNAALCKCECGKEKWFKIYRLEKGEAKKCGYCYNGKPYSSFIGKKYGYLTILSFDGSEAICKCDCNNKQIIKTRMIHLVHGNLYSCGCLKKKRQALKNICFGNLHIFNISKNKEGGLRYICKCDCGNEIEVLESDLFTGKITCCEECNELNI